VKRYSCFGHAVLHTDSDYCWNVSAFCFTYCAKAGIKQFSRLETQFVLLFDFSFISIGLPSNRSFFISRRYMHGFDFLYWQEYDYYTIY